jgi:hypothetical protein
LRLRITIRVALGGAAPDFATDELVENLKIVGRG